MDIGEHIGIVQREGELLASTAEHLDLDARVPTCPGWSVRDLVRHISGIHSWATAIISRSRDGPFDPFVEMEGKWPADAALIDSFRQGHAALVHTLQTAPADLECFTFLPASSPLAFWARRQAHETGMHRVDAESAAGAITPFAADQAADGIDELLFGFMGRRGQRLHTDSSRTLLLEATDVAANWLVRIGPEEPVVTRERASGADCRIGGSASDLFTFVWNRRSADGLHIQGDRSLLDLWRQSVFVRWR
jgi:uncharacterized protein (TIGR03083 family)